VDDTRNLRIIASSIFSRFSGDRFSAHSSMLCPDAFDDTFGCFFIADVR
jgi:hypothetical protein